ncbi:DUF2155 domain-containing protein [Rhodobacteraceae bacterium 2CG4]|uniref:DUF2155 domain-containing protein n=2 Tax=Halovulum marinum TaxID=2662447 RepID=A0A6L5YXX6_9RHOB|nr:DUF2155 domain-containing protein [Halovulum marinum]
MRAALAALALCGAALTAAAQDVDLNDPGILTLPLDQLPRGPNDPAPQPDAQPQPAEEQPDAQPQPAEEQPEPRPLDDPFADEPRARLPDPAPAGAQAPPGEMLEAPKARLRGLDKLSNTVNDFEIRVGETLAFKRLVVTLAACRYPRGDITEEAYAFLKIRDRREEEDRFSGWMLASSPALSALDHPRYDVWVLSCNTD